MRELVLTAATVLSVSCRSGDDDSRSGRSDSVEPPTSTQQASDSPRLGDTDPGASSDPGPLVITPDGWGPLRIGMSRADVVAAAGEDANPDAVGGPDPSRCDEFRPAGAPAGVLVMLNDGILTRVSVSRNPEIVSPAGIRVGDTGTETLRRLGAEATVEDHHFWDPPAKYITVWQPSIAGQGSRGILYEVDSADKIVSIRGGTESIRRVEGCI